MLDRKKFNRDDYSPASIGDKKDLVEPQKSVERLLAGMTKIQELYKEQTRNANQFFTNVEARNDLFEYAKSARALLFSYTGNREFGATFIDAVKSPAFVPTLDKESEVAKMLSQFFSYFPEYLQHLTDDLLKKLTIDFSWMKKYLGEEKESKAVVKAESMDKKDVQLDSPKPKSRHTKRDFDEIYKDFESYLDSDEEDNAEDFVENILKSGTQEEKKVHTEKLMKELDFLTTPGGIVELQYVINITDIIAHGLKYNAFTAEQVATISSKILNETRFGVIKEALIESPLTPQAHFEILLQKRMNKKLDEHQQYPITRLSLFVAAIPRANIQQLIAMRIELMAFLQKNKVDSWDERVLRAFKAVMLILTKMPKNAEEDKALSESRQLCSPLLLKRWETCMSLNIFASHVLPEMNQILKNLPACERIVLIRKLLPSIEGAADNGAKFLKDLFKDVPSFKLDDFVQRRSLAFTA
jgi:hypothetical protein